MDSFEFTFVTYNIDGRKIQRDERLRAFLEKIKSNQPDIVVVQEGTRLTYEKLLREMGLMGYKRQLLDIMNSREYGELIFSKFPISRGNYLHFRKTSENRGISYLKINLEDFRIPNEKEGTHEPYSLWICTSQFDEQQALSRMQINNFPILMRHFPKEDIVIFGGDTRILEYQKDLSEPEGWYDSWYEAGNEVSKYTYDSSINFLVKIPYKDRPDRIWYRSPLQTNYVPNKNIKIECEDCKLYGEDNSIAISSHYGVWAKFKLSKE